jgi:AraC-like DNA-binding protein
MAFSSFLRRVGAPVDSYLGYNRLPVLCEDPDAVVPLARAWSYFYYAARREDLALGWLVAKHVGRHSLNDGFLRKLETSPSLLQALRRFVRMATSEASHLQLGIRERQDDVLLFTHYPGLKESRGYMTSQFYQLGIFIDLVRHFVGRPWVPDEIGIEHAVVPRTVKEDPAGSRILTQQQVGYVAVPRTFLYKATHRTEQRDDPEGDSVQAARLDYVDTLRALLKAYLSEGYPSARFAASLIDTSERTLARRLSECGLTYGALVDEVRFTMARDLLAKPDARIADVCWAVGFDDQSHFTRMCRRIGGLTPKQIRKLALTSAVG